MSSLLKILVYHSRSMTPRTAVWAVEYIKAGEFNAFIRVNVEQHAVSVGQRRAMYRLVSCYYDFRAATRTDFDFMAERQDKVVHPDSRRYERKPKPVRKQSTRNRRKIPSGAERRTTYHAVGDDVFAELRPIDIYIHTQRRRYV